MPPGMSGRSQREPEDREQENEGEAEEGRRAQGEAG